MFGISMSIIIAVIIGILLGIFVWPMVKGYLPFGKEE